MARDVYTVKELMDELARFPEDAEVYLEYGHNAMSRHPAPEFKAAKRSAYWYVLPQDRYGAPSGEHQEDRGMVVFL